MAACHPVWARVSILAIALSLLPACEAELDEPAFARRAERTYLDIHPGWIVVRRIESGTVFARGDQQDILPIADLYAEYQKGHLRASAFFDAYVRAQKELADQRRRSLEQAKADVIPILKGAAWVRAQDLEAVGSPRERAKIRPWRQPISSDMFVILGIAEGRIGYRFASIDEVGTSTVGAAAWLTRAVRNLSAKVGKSEGRASNHSGAKRKLRAVEFEDVDGVSALVLDPGFRKRMLDRFGLPELGAAVPARNILIVFDPSDFETVRAAQAHARGLYETRNHPGLRVLLRFDHDDVSVLAPAAVASEGRGS